MITFEEYLIGKKIDSAAFQQQEADRWEAYRIIFEQMHPESFTTQKKFVINDLRRHYRLKSIPQPIANTEEKRAAKPVMRPVAPKPSETIIEEIISSETEKTVPTEITQTITEESLKQVTKPVMRPVVRKATETPSESSEPASIEKSQKTARPVMKPVMKKPGTETLEEKQAEPGDQSLQPETEKKMVTDEESKLIETPVSKPVMKKPVMRPIIKKPAPDKPTE